MRNSDGRSASTLLSTDRLELRPLPARAAGALPHDRDGAARILDAIVIPSWPQADLLDVLPSQAAASPSAERFGIWVMIERRTNTVVGDVGFVGPPSESGSIEVGYGVVPDRRRRGYATEALRALLDWALRQPRVRVVEAACDQSNLASVRTLERVGFVRVGEVDGQIRWRYAPAER